MGETGETCETGEKINFFERQISAFGRELKIQLTFWSKKGPEGRTNNKILTGLTGLADPTRPHDRVASTWQEKLSSKPAAHDR
jgi:hypothetical protein